MRIGLNATCFNNRPSGANQRFLKIYGTLIRRHPDIEFVVYEPTDQRIADWFGGAPNVSARRTPLPSIGRAARLRAGMGYWRQQLRADQLDVFETFHLPLVRAPDCPTILTIHDLRPLSVDEPFLRRLAAGLVMHRAFDRADRIVAVSGAVRAEILAFHPKASISVIYNGVDPAEFVPPAAATIAEVRRRYSLPDRYVLAIGHLEARKNLGLLVEAIGALRDAGKPRALAIVGNDGGMRDAIVSQIAALGLGELITVIGQADDGAVRALYAGCDLLAFPSRYEGFGIPILEAMAADKPMVLADKAVFRELTQGNGLYFPVDDATAAADAIERLWHQPAERLRQVEYGRKRLTDFAFDTLSDQVAALYRTIIR